MNVDRELVFGERPQAVERIAPGFFSPAFEREHVARYQWAAQFIRAGTILDVACGTGYGAELLKRRGQRTLSSDLSLPALRFGVHEYGIQAVCADGHGLPFGGTSMDAVVSLETIEHLANPDRFVREAHRVLRPSGLFIFSTPNRLLSPGGNPYHVREFMLDELLSMVCDIGFVNQDVWGQHWRLPALFRRIPGSRRLAWEFERLPHVIRRPIPGAAPGIWCLLCKKP